MQHYSVPFIGDLCENLNIKSYIFLYAAINKLVTETKFLVS